MENQQVFGTWGDVFNGVRGETALQKAYARTTDFRELVCRLPNRPPFMLARDVAAVYGVATKRLMQQARRNMDLGNAEFLFQLMEEDVQTLQNARFNGQRLQNVTFTHLPYGFTQLGANKIAFYLKSEVAQERSTQILKAFIHFEELHKRGELPGRGNFGQGLLVSGILQAEGFSVADTAALCWFRGKQLTQVEVAKIFGCDVHRIKRVERALRDAGISLPQVKANTRAKQMQAFFKRLIGFKDQRLSLREGGAE